MSPTTYFRSIAVTLLSAAAIAVTASPAAAVQHGPAPTATSITGTGPYAVASRTLADSATPGFGGAAVFYPTNTADGPYATIAIAPGFTSMRDQIDWYGPRLASWGFVVMTFDTLSLVDFPGQRADQLLAALDYLTSPANPVRSRVNPNALVVMGHSMGGGGALEAAVKRPSVKAAISLTGWNLQTNFSQLRVPTLVVGSDGDGTAPIVWFSDAFYKTLAGPKAYVVLNNASHYSPLFIPNPTISRLSVSWLKRYADGDTRFTQFLCPGPAAGADLDSYSATCPL